MDEDRKLLAQRAHWLTDQARKDADVQAAVSGFLARTGRKNLSELASEDPEAFAALYDGLEFLVGEIPRELL